jgi:hypothetical protein
LHVSEIGGRVRLSLGEFGYADGATLQSCGRACAPPARDRDGFRTSGFGRMYSECRPDPALLEFIWELGDIAARGGDIRERLFGGEGARRRARGVSGRSRTSPSEHRQGTGK